MESIAKIDFSRKSFFLWISESILLFFVGLGSGFSGCLGLENKLENETIFSDITDPETLNWRDGSTTDLRSLKT